MSKTIFITGASSGIGKASAALFARAEWNVIATVRTPGGGTELADMPNVLVVPMDVRDLASIHAAIDAGLARFGRIDVLVNNAGYGQYGIFEGIAREKVQEQFDVNVFGVMDVTRAFLPHFRKNQSGVIINISSGAGFYTVPMISLYCASKFALEGFSEGLAYELASQNITVKIVEPHGGVTSTSFNERAARHRATDTTLSDYDVFVKRMGESFAKMSAGRTTSADDVAQVIHTAATDGTDRLRYLVGNDTRGFVQARQTLPDDEYVKYMRSHFAHNSEPDSL